MAEQLPELLAALLIQVEGSPYVLDTRDVVACHVLEEVVSIPGVSPTLLGVTLVESRPVLVVELSALLLGESRRGSELIEGHASHLVLCRCGEELVGLIAGQVRGVSELRELRGGEDGDFWRGSVEWRGGKAFVLAPDRILEWVTTHAEQGKP